MTPLESTARVATNQAGLYLKRFCEHVARQRERHGAPEVEVTFDDSEGSVNFAPLISGTCRLNARQEGLLVVDATGTDEAALKRIQRLVTEHLERFGRGELTVNWGTASGERLP